MGRNNDLGAWGERQAARFLIRKGFTLTAHNYHCRWGELDLIMEDPAYLVFVEVKLRKNARYGTPGEYVTPRKQEKLRMTAQAYLQEFPTEKQPRFDVVEIYAPKGQETNPVAVHHIENAF